MNCFARKLLLIFRKTVEVGCKTGIRFLYFEHVFIIMLFLASKTRISYPIFVLFQVFFIWISEIYSFAHIKLRFYGNVKYYPSAGIVLYG